MNNQDIVVGLDIGTTKICAIIGRITEHGKVEVIGMGKAESLGVSRGVVSNIDKTVEAITKATADAEKAAQMHKDFENFKITEVYVGIAGQHIKSLQHRGILA